MKNKSTSAVSQQKKIEYGSDAIINCNNALDAGEFTQKVLECLGAGVGEIKVVLKAKDGKTHFSLIPIDELRVQLATACDDFVESFNKDLQGTKSNVS